MLLLSRMLRTMPPFKIWSLKSSITVREMPVSRRLREHRRRWNRILLLPSWRTTRSSWQRRWNSWETLRPRLSKPKVRSRKDSSPENLWTMLLMLKSLASIQPTSPLRAISSEVYLFSRNSTSWSQIAFSRKNHINKISLMCTHWE